MADQTQRRPRNPHRAESWQPTVLRTVRVGAVVDLAPELVRVTLEGAQLGEFTTATGSLAPAVRSPCFDDVVVFCLPDPVTGELILPVPGPGGGLTHPSGGTAIVREYTVRSLDEHSLCVDLVRHDSGAGVRWLEAVRPGDSLTIVAPRVSRALPAVDRMLAVGDATALPALARLIDDLPPTMRLDVVAAVRDPASLPDVPPPTVDPDLTGRVTVTVVAEAAGSARGIINALAGVDVPVGFAWVAGESGMVGEVRRHLLNRGQDPDRVQFTGYWRQGEAS